MAGMQVFFEPQVPLAQKGVANGVATLGADGKVPYSELPDSVTAGFVFIGTWAATNVSGTILTNGGLYDDGGGVVQAAAGEFFRVSTGSLTTTLDGVDDWQPGDWAVSTGAAWTKSDNNDAVSTVAGRKGDIVLTTADITNLPVAAASTLLQAGAVSISQMAPASVGTSQYVGGSVDTTALGTNSVTTVKITDLHVTTAKVAALAITNAKVADGAVSTRTIVDETVTRAKLAIRDSSYLYVAAFGGSILRLESGAGSLITDNAGDVHRSFYSWEGGAAGPFGVASLYLALTLPADFLDWDNGAAADNVEIKFSTASTLVADNVLAVTASDTAGSECTLTGVNGLVSTSAGVPRTVSTSWTSGTFAGGSCIQLKFLMSSKKTFPVRIYSVRLNYRTQ